MARDNPAISILAWLWPLFALAVPLVVIVALATLAPTVLQRVVTDALIKLVMVVGLYIFVGNSGVLSFGHAAFMIIGAYMSAWLTMKVAIKKIMLPDLPALLGGAEIHVLPGALAGGALSAVIALIVGVPLMRLSGIAAAIGTFAIFTIVSVVYNNWDEFTKGASTLIGLRPYIDLWVALGYALAAMTIAYIYQRSQFGLMLRASREDPVAARAAGVDIHRQRLIAFVISGFVVGIGGVMFGHFLAALTQANQLYLNITFITIVMLVVGGTQSLAGAVAGVMAVSTVAEILRRFEGGVELAGVTLDAPAGLSELGLALFMLLILILRPKGIAGGHEVPLPGFLRRAS